MAKPALSFDDFIDIFPEIELPITLNDEIHLIFSKKNKAIDPILIQQFILPIESEVDDLSEFVACFKVPATHLFHAIVYWKASLMNYHYCLATYTKKGDLIDNRVIAGTYSDGKKLTTSIATIDDDWTIFIASGQSAFNASQQYDASSSTTYKLELLPEGQIINVTNRATN